MTKVEMATRISLMEACIRGKDAQIAGMRLCILRREQALRDVRQVTRKALGWN